MGKRFIKILIELKDEFLDFIYPPEEGCTICGEDGFIGICALCESKIKLDKEENEIISYGQYGGVLKRLILSFKYKQNFLVGRILARYLYNRLIEVEYYPDTILFVPLSKGAKKKRGFNQCEFLAKELSKLIDSDYKKLVVKTRETKEQKRLSINERHENVLGSFILKDSKSLENKRILIIDDVVTTGATLLECKSLFKDEKIKDIKLLTVARSRL